MKSPLGTQSFHRLRIRSGSNTTQFKGGSANAEAGPSGSRFDNAEAGPTTSCPTIINAEEDPSGSSRCATPDHPDPEAVKRWSPDWRVYGLQDSTWNSNAKFDF